MPGSEYISLQKPAESQGGEDLPKRMSVLRLQDTRYFFFGKRRRLSCLSGRNGGGPCARLLIKRSSHHRVQLIIPDCAVFNISLAFPICSHTFVHLFLRLRGDIRTILHALMIK